MNNDINNGLSSTQNIISVVTEIKTAIQLLSNTVKELTLNSKNLNTIGEENIQNFNSMKLTIDTIIKDNERSINSN